MKSIRVIEALTRLDKVKFNNLLNNFYRIFIQSKQILSPNFSWIECKKGKNELSINLDYLDGF